MSDLITELEDLGKALATNLTNKGVTASYTDGLTTLANKVLTIPQGSGGHCYGVVFDSTSIIGVQGTATVGVTIYDNYAPLSNVTVTLTGSDSSTRTATTNSQGYATFTTSGTSGTTISYSITYQGVTKNCSVTYISHLFYDDCSVDNTNNYTSISLLNSNGTASITYDSNRQAYAIKRANTGTSMLQLGNLTLQNNMKISADMNINGTSWLKNGFICFADKDNPKTYCVGGFAQGETYYRLMEWNGSSELQTTPNSKWGDFVTNDYNHHELTYQNGVVTYTITTKHNVSKTVTLTLIGTNYIGGAVGFFIDNTGGNPQCYVKNIKAEPI